MVNMRVIVAVTGASGAIYAKRLLEVLQAKNIETHLTMSEAAERVVAQELELGREDLEKLATYAHSVDDLGAPISSGSFKTDGMIIVPCSMKTLAGISHGYTDNLVLRAADVVLKEKRKLVLVVRETPLSIIHLRNMLDLAKQGVTILPAMPGYYYKPKTVNALADYIVGKILDILQIEHDLFTRWIGVEQESPS
jgi:4-hydroxy-3-polyprenylbenzoate decarboxylase